MPLIANCIATWRDLYHHPDCSNSGCVLVALGFVPVCTLGNGVCVRFCRAFSFPHIAPPTALCYGTSYIQAAFANSWPSLCSSCTANFGAGETTITLYIVVIQMRFSLVTSACIMCKLIHACKCYSKQGKASSVPDHTFNLRCVTLSTALCHSADQALPSCPVRQVACLNHM